MLSFHQNLRVFVALEPVDMRKSFNGLWALAAQKLREDPSQGALFVFSNRRRDRLKVLYVDRTGVCVLAKRLEKGTFRWPSSARAESTKLSLTPEALQLLIDGVDLKDAGTRAWYERG